MKAMPVRCLFSALILLATTLNVAGFSLGRGFFVKTSSNPASSCSKNSNKRLFSFSPSQNDNDGDLAASPKKNVRRNSLEKFLDDLFDKADTNKDGSISITETYTLVLKLYVRINREAPVSVPTQTKIQELFSSADLNDDGRLDKDEFRRLMLVLYSRATLRIVSHKGVKMVVAPLLALKVFRFLNGQEWVDNMAKFVPEGLSGVMLNPNFWRTLLTVGFVVSLGNIALRVADVILDAVHLNKKNGDGD